MQLHKLCKETCITRNFYFGEIHRDPQETSKQKPTPYASFFTKFMQLHLNLPECRLSCDGGCNLPDRLSGAGAAPQPRVMRGFLLKVSFIAGLGGILYGYDMGIIAAALIFVRSSFVLSTQMEEAVVSVVLVGA